MGKNLASAISSGGAAAGAGNTTGAVGTTDDAAAMPVSTPDHFSPNPPE